MSEASSSARLFLPLAELAERIRSRQLSSVELLQQTLVRIEELEPRLNSYITVARESALAEARQADAELARGHWRGPLHGVPLALKDLFATRGLRTTAGSKILADWVPDSDATAVARLRAAGAVIVGKNNLHEFAYGVTNENFHYGPAHNPWEPARIPGGSSGGSAAAVAAGLAAAAVGSDTGGSIRIPAAACGIVGLKPSYGRVSRSGVIPLAESLDHVGPITRTVEDAALLLGVLAGEDPGDDTSSPLPVPDYRAALTGDIRGLRFAFPREYSLEDVQPDVARAFEQALAELERLGAIRRELSVPGLDRALEIQAAIISAEATAYHEENLTRRPGDYGENVRFRLEQGRTRLATEYVRRQSERRQLRRALAAALEQVDVLLTPTLAMTAPRIGEEQVQTGRQRERVLAASLRYTVAYNLAGVPALSVPCGFDSAGLPIGLQIAGRAFDEATLLRAAHAYESHTEWHRRHPSL